MFKTILALALLAGSTAEAGKLQNSDFATAAQITGAGGTTAQLLNTSKIFDSTNSQLLDTTIAAKLNTSAFTDAAVTGKLITGYVSGAGVVSATDTILEAIEKLNGNIDAITDTGITQLTGDVTAGPGSGSQAATIANLAVTNAKIANSTIDLTAKVTGILPNANTTADSANTASAIVARDGSGNFSAGNISAALSGNASTSTALAANPADCSSGQFATTIAANGDLTCAAIANTDLPAPAVAAIAASDIDWSLGKNKDYLYTKTLSANTTFTFSNVTAGQTIVIAVTNTASNFTLTWPAAAKWAAGTAPTQTVGAKTDVYTCKAFDSTNAYCVAQQNY